jgi:hypothetical protein
MFNIFLNCLMAIYCFYMLVLAIFMSFVTSAPCAILQFKLKRFLAQVLLAPWALSTELHSSLLTC